MTIIRMCVMVVYPQQFYLFAVDEYYIPPDLYTPQAYTLQHFLFNRFHAGDFASVTAAAYLFTPVVFLCGAIFARGTKT